MNQNKYNSATLYRKNLQEECFFVDNKKVDDWIENLFAWLFSTKESGLDFDLFQQAEMQLQDDLQIILAQVQVLDFKVVSDTFFEGLLLIHSNLVSDLKAILDFDPAAKSRTEVLLAYPGFFAVFVYRIAHAIWELNVLVLPRLLSEYAHSKTGIDIHPAAKIDERFFIDHGTGIVIGETAKIGKNVKIYQGVTLGALSVSKEKAKQKRHPTIEDDVIIYANATILGGNTTIGKGAVIGGNVWITASIPAQSLVYHKSENVVRTKIEFTNSIDFSI